MNPLTIEIHEFSTGIRPRKTADGWVSLGFTGKYMNMTRDVPEAIERSIANREFAVSEGSSSDNPAVIGRVVGTGEDVWSVMAVVSRGRDEKGRSVSMYRYFFCKGGESLGHILAWWKDKQEPKFNPFDTKNIGDYKLFQINSVEDITEFVNNLEQILLGSNALPKLPTNNNLASNKSNNYQNGQSISWAFNVEGLEKPWLFQVIYPASEKAYQILEKSIKNTPQILAPVLIDEEAMKSAIRGLMNSSQVKGELVEVIVDALNKDTNVEYFHTLFDAQGAKTAIKQKIYSPQMVRLITLRAIVIPGTIPEFLDWLNIKLGKKLDQNQTISLEFQKAIRSYLSKEKLVDDIKLLLPQLLNHSSEITPEFIYWLLGESESAWYLCRQPFIKQISDDLQSMYDYYKLHQTPKNNYPTETYNCHSGTWDKIAKKWRQIYSPLSPDHCKEYISFARLFEYLEEYQLSAYFYQVSKGEVPTNIFEKVYLKGKNTLNSNIFELLRLQLIKILILFSLTKSANLKVFGLQLKLQEFKVQIQIVIPLSIILFISGLFIGSKFLGQQSSESELPTDKKESMSQEKGINEENNPTEKISGIDTGYINNSTGKTKIKDDQLIKNAIKQENFKKTTNSINKIVSQINNKRSIKNAIIINEIKQVLNAPELNYDKIDDESSEKNKLAEAIYHYQKKHFDNEANGYLIEKSTIFDLLQREVEQNLNQQEHQN